MPLPAIVAAGAAAYRAYKTGRAALVAYKAYKAARAAAQAAKAAKAARSASRVASKARKASHAAKSAKKARKSSSGRKRKSRQACNSVECQRRRAVREAWKKERERVQRGEDGSRNWTPKERKELLETGKVKGYQGHHINSVKGSPNLAGNPNNIKFVKGTAAHLKEHGGSFQNPTRGPLIYRYPDAGAP